MAHDTDVGGRSITSLRWAPPFLGRATAELVMWTAILAVAILTAALADLIAAHLRRLKDSTNDPRVVEALRVANLPEEKRT